MTRTFRNWLRQLQWRWFACGVFVTGCTHPMIPLTPPDAKVQQVALQPGQSPYGAIEPAPTNSKPTPTKLETPVPMGGIRQVGYQEPKAQKSEALPEPRKEESPVEETTQTPLADAAEGEIIPISLDTLFRLAEMHNARVGLARERLHESSMLHCQACQRWLPRITAGIGYYRHEGGIQNEDGTLTHSSTGAVYPGLDFRGVLDPKERAFRQVQAQRKIWQRRGELRKVENEIFLEAAELYVDILSARQAEATIREVQGHFEELLERAEKLVQEDRRARILVESTKAELSARRMAQIQLRARAEAASAKLAYLLGMGQAKPSPMETQLVPIDLVDPTPSTQALVSQALHNGPGVHELRQLLGVIHGGIAQLESSSVWMPSFEVSVTEGAFGAGPGATLDWDNRLDIGVQARWDITSLFSARDQKLAALSKLRQAELTYADLQGKLTAGVRAARSVSLQGRSQIQAGATTIEHTASTFELAKTRLQERIRGASFEEVIRSIRGLEQAHVEYLKAVNAYNKSQIQLLLLTGGGQAPTHHPEHVVVPPMPLEGYEPR